MDILFSAGWKQRRPTASRRPAEWTGTPPSGASRLLLALAVIAAIVGVLGHATATVSPAGIATMQGHTGEAK